MNIFYITILIYLITKIDGSPDINKNFFFLHIAVVFILPLSTSGISKKFDVYILIWNILISANRTNIPLINMCHDYYYYYHIFVVFAWFLCNVSSWYSRASARLHIIVAVDAQALVIKTRNIHNLIRTTYLSTQKDEGNEESCRVI